MTAKRKPTNDRCYVALLLVEKAPANLDNWVLYDIAHHASTDQYRDKNHRRLEAAECQIESQTWPVSVKHVNITSSRSIGFLLG